jgi:hypothetical protein
MILILILILNDNPSKLGRKTNNSTLVTMQVAQLSSDVAANGTLRLEAQQRVLHVPFRRLSSARAILRDIASHVPAKLTWHIHPLLLLPP